MKTNEQPILSADMRVLLPYLTRWMREVAAQINSMAEGYVQAATNAATAAPTAGDFNQGDFVRNLTPTELGAAGSKYVVYGWSCVAAGSPGTWRPCRVLTGN